MTTEELYAREVIYNMRRDRWIASLGMKPYEWQSAVLQSKSKRKAILGTRQAGKSTIVSGIPCHRAKYYPRSLSIILAPTQGQARDDMAKTRQYIASDKTYPELKKCSEDRIELSNGSIIEVVTATDTSARGKSSPDVIVIDEASRVSDIVYSSAVRPMLTENTKCELILISTPNGKQGFFYNSCEGLNPVWERYKILSPWLVVNDGYDLMKANISSVTLSAQAKAEGYAGIWYSPRHFNYKEQLDNLLEMGPLLFKQEYLCEFVESQGQVFSNDDIARAFDLGGKVASAGTVLEDATLPSSTDSNITLDDIDKLLEVC